jgi:hypothetical protein
MVLMTFGIILPTFLSFSFNLFFYSSLFFFSFFFSLHFCFYPHLDSSFDMGRLEMLDFMFLG